jgi:hypothetical protein
MISESPGKRAADGLQGSWVGELSVVDGESGLGGGDGLGGLTSLDVAGTVGRLLSVRRHYCRALLEWFGRVYGVESGEGEDEREGLDHQLTLGTWSLYTVAGTSLGLFADLILFRFEGLSFQLAPSNLTRTFGS